MDTSLCVSDALSHEELFDSSSREEHIQRDEEMDIENEKNEESQPKVQMRGRKEIQLEERLPRSRLSCEAEDKSREMSHNELPDKPLDGLQLLSQQSSNSLGTDRIPQLRIPRIRHKKIQKIKSSSEEENAPEEETAELHKQTHQSPEK